MARHKKREKMIEPTDEQLKDYQDVKDLLGIKPIIKDYKDVKEFLEKRTKEYRKIIYTWILGDPLESIKINEEDLKNGDEKYLNIINNIKRKINEVFPKNIQLYLSGNKDRLEDSEYVAAQKFLEKRTATYFKIADEYSFGDCVIEEIVVTGKIKFGNLKKSEKDRKYFDLLIQIQKLFKELASEEVIEFFQNVNDGIITDTQSEDLVFIS